MPLDEECRKGPHYSSALVEQGVYLLTVFIGKQERGMGGGTDVFMRRVSRLWMDMIIWHIGIAINHRFPKIRWMGSWVSRGIDVPKLGESNIFPVPSIPENESFLFVNRL